MLSVIQWWRLMLNPAKHYELPSMELSWAWEPAYREGAWRFDPGKRSLCLVHSRDMGR